MSKMSKSKSAPKTPARAGAPSPGATTSADVKLASSAPQAGASRLPANGQVRAVVDAVLPAVDGGRFAVKRVAGERVDITAHCFTDGHDELRVMLQWRAEGQADVH